MRSHPIPATLIAMTIVGGLGCKKETPPGPGADPKPEATLSAAELCDAVYDAPQRHLGARCSSDDKQRKQYRYLVGLSTEARTQCTARLGTLASRGSVRLRADAARRCGQVLESTSWKETLAILDVTRFPECRGLITGTLAQGQSCENSLECAPDLACSRAPGSPQGICDKPRPAGSPCERIVIDALGDQRSCGPGAACSSRLSNRFLSNTLGAQPRELDPSQVARAKALRDAAEFGMIGLLNSGEGPASGGLLDASRGEGIDALESARGEGIGLGSIGFGSGQGRLGGRRTAKPPQLRMGAVTVNGRLLPEVIQRIVRQSFGRFRLCYENGLRNNPTLGGRVTVHFVIGRDGSVSNIGNGASDLPDSGVVSCVTRAFYGLSFPQPEGGIVSVSYPILFEPSKDATPASSAAAGAPAGADAGAPAEADAGAPALVGSGSPAEAGRTPETAPPSNGLYIVQEGICAVLARAGDSCANGEPCADGLVCRLGKCSNDPRGGSGDACEHGEDCQPGLHCGIPDGDGPAARDRGVCAARKAAGAECTSSVQCDGLCISGKCAAFCGSR